MTKRLSFLDQYLTLWILLAMVIGVGLGYFLPSMPLAVESMSVGTTNIPLAIGLVMMMFPPLTKVNYAEMPKIFQQPKLLWLSLLQNWIIGPVLMALVGAVFLRSEPAYFQGLMLVGIARCIAMVMVWSQLADGDNQYTAGLVAFNAVFQVLFYPLYAFLFVTWLPPILGMEGSVVPLTMADVAMSVGIYLGTPLLLGALLRWWSIKSKGYGWYSTVLLPAISPLTLVFLLLTIVIMFSLKAGVMLTLPMDVLMIAVPLSIYFLIMFFLGYWSAAKAGANHDKRVSLAFTAAGNNFELGIAVAISVFGLQSGQALATVVGPLVEVPVLVLLVSAARRLAPRE